jgi:hypothetical protein
MMAHGSAAFTLTVYGHLFDADMDAVADALDVSDAGRSRDGSATNDRAKRASPPKPARLLLRGWDSNPQRTDQQ